MKKKYTFDPLLTLRGITAMAILVYHMQYPVVYLPTLFGKNILWITYANGYVAVWIFFILSGYLIGKGFFTQRYLLSVNGLKIYLIKRFLRIVPAYYFIALISVFVFGIWKAVDKWNIIIKVITFTANDQVLRFGVDYFWAISAEIQFYLLAPLLFLIIKKFISNKKYVFFLFSIMVMSMGFILRFIAYEKSFPYWPADYLLYIYSPTIYNLDFFIFGMGLNLLLIRSNHSQKTGINNIFKYLLVGFSLIFLYYISSITRYHSMNEFAKYITIQGLLLPMITMVVIGLFIYVYENPVYFRSKGFALNKCQLTLNLFLPLQLFQLTGAISYEFYLVHLPLMNILGLHCLVDSYGCAINSFFQRFAMLLGISIFLSWLLHRIIQTLLRPGYRYLSALSQTQSSEKIP